MKKTKKVFALLIAMVMVLGMSTAAFAAAGDYTITINGSQKDAVYTAYKIFDATITSDGKIAYTVEENSALETLLRGETSDAKTAFLDVFEITDNGGRIYVTQKGSATDIAGWMAENAATYKIGTTTEVTNTSGAPSVTLDVGSAGYYYITSTLGTKSAVMLTSTNPKVTINDKIPTKPDIPEEAKKVKIGNETVDVTTLDLGTVVGFEITINAVNYVTNDNGESEIVYEYNVADAPSGFAIDENSVSVAISEGTYAGTITKSVDANGKLTVKIPWADGAGTTEDPYTAKYVTPNTITVSYNATLTAVTSANNKAQIGYNSDEIGEDEVYVYNYTIDVDKVDIESTTTKLPGAEFAIKKTDAQGKDTYYQYTAATETAPAKVDWVENIADATTKWTSTDGTQEGTTYQQAVFEGLAAGSYTLVEVTAPKGYNLADDQPFTLNAVTEELEGTTTLTVSMEVKDAKGSTLPATGGIGTTIFYIVGTVLVIGAGVVMITRRRMDA